jgi:hypothetical protein
MEWLALAAAFIIAGLAVAKVLGDASDLGHGERRQTPRKGPLDFDTEFL